MLYHATFNGNIAILTPADLSPKPATHTGALPRVKPLPTTAPPRPNPPARINPAIPRAQWPRAVRLLALLRQPGDHGIGDIIERLIGPIGGTAVKAWSQRMGIDCGCNARKDAWNTKWPL